MKYWQLFLNDIFLSPIVYHFVAFVISTIKALWVKHYLRCIYESEYWGRTMMVLMFFNPLLAFAADSFWIIWLQTLVLSIPLACLGSYYRQFILQVDNGYSADMQMVGVVTLGAYGQIASGIIALIIYICKSISNWIW